MTSKASRPRFWPLALLVGASMPACASFSTHLVPRPTEKGKTELIASLDVLATNSRELGEEGEAIIAPFPELGIRYGLSEIADFGAKLSLSKAGGEVNSRIALVKSEVFDLAVVPGAGMALGSPTSDKQVGLVVSFGMPVLAGIKVGDVVQFVVGGKFLGHFGTISTDGDGGDVNEGVFILYPGGVFGVALKLGETFMLMPEINVHVPYDTDTRDWYDPVFQGGLAFMFGV